jgi:hypothetical protein
MDDVVIEETMTYVARELGPMITTAQGREADPRDFSGVSTLDPEVVFP